ncbi:MAG: hypothetical protein ACOX3B_00430 [Bacilli bacterium]
MSIGLVALKVKRGKVNSSTLEEGNSSLESSLTLSLSALSTSLLSSLLSSLTTSLSVP